MSEYCALTAEEFERLALYNGEVSRGIVHTFEYEERMRDLQQRWDVIKREPIYPSKRRRSYWYTNDFRESK